MTIACCAIVLIIAIISVHSNAFFRKLHENGRQDAVNMPKLSVIITAHDQAKELEENLSAILSQVYAPGFEVIVVNAASSDDTEEVLKRFKSHNENLYTTFTPDSSRYMSRKKLAITLGIKAAKNEWIVLTEAYCIPESEHWLEAIGSRCTEQTDLVLGYSNFVKAKNLFRKFINFERMYNQYVDMQEASKGIAYRAGGRNLAFRRSRFMKHNGFVSNLRYLRGEYDFLVNDLANKGRTAVVIEKEGRLTEQVPSAKSWRNSHLFYMETRKHLYRKFHHRMIYNIDTTLMVVNYLIQIATFAISALYAKWLITIAASVALLLTIILRTIYGYHVVRRLNEKTPILCIVPYEIFSVISKFGYKLRYMMADKMNFIRK